MGILDILRSTTEKTAEMADKLNMGDGNVNAKEGLNLEDDDPYKKLLRAKAKNAESAYTFSTMNTIMAIKDVRRRRRIVTRRINRLKCLIIFLLCLAFILSWPYFFIANVMYNHQNEDTRTLAFNFMYSQVTGTTNFECFLSVVLFVLSGFRVFLPKKEFLYYLTQIAYLFAVIHYIVLIPLNGRSLYKNLSELEMRMEKEMTLGRCFKTESSASVPSVFKTYSRNVDTHGCILSERNMEMSHIRPLTQTECDGEGSWYAKATSLALNPGRFQEIINGTTPPVRYEVFSKAWATSQRLQGCCGIKSLRDWQKTDGKQYIEFTKVHMARGIEKFIYPDSCCNASLFANSSSINMCTGQFAFQGHCTATERVTIIEYSLGLLVTLVVCAIFNFTIFTLLSRFRTMVVRFRPDLLEM